MNHQTDQTKLRRLQNRIRARKGLIGCGDEFTVALHSCGKLVYVGTDRWGQEEARTWTEVASFACGRDHIVALLEDGSVRMAGRCSALKPWTDQLSCIRTVTSGRQHVAVLLSNGRVMAKGEGRHGQCLTEDWPAVTDVVCGKTFTAGLTARGQVVISGGSAPLRHTVRSWRQVAGIFTDHNGRSVYAITAEGKLLSAVPLPRRVEEWKNLVFVAVNNRHIWAVTATGQLLSTDPAADRMNSAKHYISCAVSDTHALALSKDGLVLSQGQNDFGQCNTARFGPLYAGFEEFSADRRTKNTRMEADERTYQIHLVEALRYKKRMVCGDRITACINADGRVLTTADLRECREWSQVRALAGGNAHLLALHEGGLVSADGNDVDGCTAVADWRNIKSIAAGKYHSLGLTEDGQVFFCGRNDQGQGNVSEWSGIRWIYASDDYTVGVTYEGRIRVAGTPPFAVDSVDEAWSHPVDIAVTPTHMVALYANGRVLSTLPASADWESEDGETCDAHGWENIRAIAAGPGFTVGLSYGGRVLAVGCNDRGQCDTVDWKQIVDIGCGDGFTVGLTADGRVLSAGDFPSSGDGLLCTETRHWQDVMAIQCGKEHTVALTRNGQMLSCGNDGDSQCSATSQFTLFRDARQLYGYGQYSRQLEMEIQANRAATSVVCETETEAEPIRFSRLTDAVQALCGSFAVGMAHSVYLDGLGRIQARGANDCGQCDIHSFGTALQVAAGPYSSAAILPDGHIVLAGRNSDGQGDARSLNHELNSSDVISGYTWKQVSCGYTHTAALRSDGRVYAIGANPDGRCDTRQWRDVTHVACGVRHTVARREDGTCLAVGDNRYGQCDITSWTDISMVAAGEFHTVALTADGRVVAAGDNRKGQCEVEDLRDVVTIACLPEATLCVSADGRVTVRGGSGELNSALEALRNVAGLDTCEHRIAAITADRELILFP